MPKGWETNRGFLAALLHSRCATFGSMFWNHSPQFNIFNCLDPRTNHQNQTSDKQGLCCPTSSLYPKLHPSSSPPLATKQKTRGRHRHFCALGQVQDLGVCLGPSPHGSGGSGATGEQSDPIAAAGGAGWAHGCLQCGDHCVARWR